MIGVLYALFLTDFVLTLITVIGLRKQLGELERVGQALHTVGDTISDRLGNSALAADAKLESAKIAGQERMVESKEKLETAVENSQRKFVEGKERLFEGKERLSDKISGSRQELQQKKQRLEARQKELVASLGESARFGTRRLTGAFPGLREEIRRRLEESKKNTGA